MKTEIKPFRERKGVAQSQYWSGELADASIAANRFIEETIQKYGLKREDGYHIEIRCVGIASASINDDTHGHFSDNEIMQLLDGKGEVVAMAYLNRNDMNCAEVIMVDLLCRKD